MSENVNNQTNTTDCDRKTNLSIRTVSIGIPGSLQLTLIRVEPNNLITCYDYGVTTFTVVPYAAKLLSYTPVRCWLEGDVSSMIPWFLERKSYLSDGW